MTTATLVLCPSGLHELPVTTYQALVECPLCGTRDWTIDLPTPDLELCGCGHRLAAHGPRHGFAYACPLSTCPCNTKPKEKPMAETDHYHEAEQLLGKAGSIRRQYNVMPERVDAQARGLTELAEAHIKLAKLDATRDQTAAIRELTTELADADKFRRSTVV